MAIGRVQIASMNCQTEWQGASNWNIHGQLVPLHMIVRHIVRGMISLEFSVLGQVFSIIVINIVLSGDNALLIALATRTLPREYRRKAVFWGVFGAVVLQVILTFSVAYLLEIPFIRGIGGILLLIIAVKLFLDDSEVTFIAQPSSNFGSAVRTIIVADLLMSLDNVLGVAGASDGNVFLLMFGLAIGIPIVIYGSNFIQRILTRWRASIYLGTAVLGWTAGEMLFKEMAFLVGHVWEYLVPLICSLAVLATGKALREFKSGATAVVQAEMTCSQSKKDATKV